MQARHARRIGVPSRLRRRSRGSRRRRPLSQEDAELVKELALLEQMDLVKNLELFQSDKEDEKEPQQLQP